METKLSQNELNLCDPEQEPSDEDLARLMESFIQEVNKRGNKIAHLLSVEIDNEIINTYGRMDAMI